MTCHEARELLSDLLDEALDPGSRALVEAHVSECAECGRELERLRATVALLRRVEPPHAPAGFVDGVMRRTHPVPWYRRMGAWLFLPLSVKLPVEAAAMVLIAVLAVYLFERTPELRDATRTAPEIPASPAPAPPPPPTPPMSAKPEARGAPGGAIALPPRTPAVKAAPEAESFARDAKEAAAPEARPQQEVAPPPPAPRMAPPPAPQMAAPAPPQGAAPASPQVAASAPPQATADQSARPPGAAESPRRQLSKSEEAQRGSAPSSVRSAAMRVATPASVVGRLDVKDRAAAVRDLADLLSRVEGRETGRREDASGTVVEILIAEARYDELIRGLEALGSWSATGRPATLPLQPPQIHVSVRIQ